MTKHDSFPEETPPESPENPEYGLSEPAPEPAKEPALLEQANETFSASIPTPEILPVETPPVSEPMEIHAPADEPPGNDQASAQTSSQPNFVSASDIYPEKPPEPRFVPPPYAPAPAQLSEGDERTWAMLAHLSILTNLVTGFLGPVVALVIFLVYKDRSRFVAYHAMQSLIFQLVFWVGGGIAAGIAWTISGILAAILIGCLLMPFALIISLVPLAALAYGVVGAVQVNQGQNFKYWLVGDWAEKIAF